MIKLLMIDLDGTVYEGDRLINGSKTAIEKLREQGLILVFCTNNSSKKVSELSDKMNRLGIRCNEGDIISSGSMAIKYACDNNLEKVYFCGSESMYEEIVNNGIDVCNENNCINMIIGMDPDYNYEKMTKGIRAAIRAKQIILCNEDMTFPGEKGLLPGCGAIGASILLPVSKKADIILGKPETMMMSVIKQKYGIAEKEMLVIGDSAESDTRMARSFGSQSLLVGDEIKSLIDAVPIIERMNDRA